MTGDRADLSGRRASDRPAPDGASLAAPGGRVRGQQRAPGAAGRGRAAGHAAATAGSAQGRRQERVSHRVWRPHPRSGACDGADPAKCGVWTSSGFGGIADELTRAETAMLRDDRGHGGGRPNTPRNVLGDRLEVCSLNPMTGFFRDGCCDTGREDIGSHAVCAVMTAAFLEFSKSRGNDLSTPMPEFGFRGLKPGDRWCLCAPRWQEALEAGQAPRGVLLANHDGALGHCSLADLKRLALDLDSTHHLPTRRAESLHYMSTRARLY